MDTSAPVMVGIDGSTASVRAALWAADEAAARDTVLDLVYVVDPARVEDLDDAMTQAHHAIHRVWEAITDGDKHVKLESEILQGNPILELAHAARRAALFCVGHKGVKDSAPLPRGSTASSLARIAPTSVAVVRRRHTHRPPRMHRWVAAVLDETHESHDVLQAALDEAELREAPVLALTTWSTSNPHPDGPPSETAGDIRAKMDRYLEASQNVSADVQVCALPLPDDVTTLLEQSAGIEQLFVIGAHRHDLLDQLTGGKARRALRGTNCSILVVRAASGAALLAAGRRNDDH
jgi:nucleotide-binding universal stress UspA family protein